MDDLERGSTVRLTTSAEFDVMPVWSPDETEVAYRTGTLEKPTIGFAASDGSGVKRTMACPKSPCEPSDWSPDGRFLVLTIGGADVWTMPVGSEGQAQPLLAESFTERDARISPNGRWLAYVSDETGRPEVSVRSLTGSAPRFVVSSGGGDQPVWRRDGAELFFAGPEGRLFAISVRPARNAGLSFGIATKLDVPSLGERHGGTIYDVSCDGQRVRHRVGMESVDQIAWSVVPNFCPTRDDRLQEHRMLVVDQRRQGQVVPLNQRHVASHRVCTGVCPNGVRRPSCGSQRQPRNQ